MPIGVKELKISFGFRILNLIRTQPVTFCFMLSLFLIAITLAALGLYIKGKDNLPDLDAMKVHS